MQRWLVEAVVIRLLVLVVSKKGFQQWLKNKPGYGRGYEKLWRRPFGWPQGSYGKPFDKSARES